MRKLKIPSGRKFLPGKWKLLKQSFLIVVLLFVGLSSFAQQAITVSGIVKDALKEPLAGASIQEKGTSSRAVSDINGQFTITVSDKNATLLFSYLGMLPQEVQLSGRTGLEVVMSDDNVVLDEVVVTALGIKRQTKALGYAMAEVKGDDITGGRDANAITALSGRMAGVDISTTAGGPSGSTRVVIRGNSQLSGSNMPLYVIDGVPMDNTQLGNAGKDGGYDMGDGLSAINPDDVESISVLKGPSAAALYGSQASNGVILITTKSGKGKKGLGIDVSMNVNAVSLLSGFDDYQRVYGQGINSQPPLEVGSANNTQRAWGAKLDPNLNSVIYNGQVKPYGNVNDNILSFFRTGVTSTNSIALSSSSEKTDFRLSVSDLRNWDIVPESDMSRTSFMLKGGATLGEKFHVEGRVNYTTENVNNRPALSDSPNNIGNSIIGIAPNFNQEWLSEGYKDADGRYIDWNANDYRLNPYWVINEMTNVSKKDRILGHAQLSYDITPYLTAQVRAGTDFYNFRFTEYSPKYTPRRVDGQIREDYSKVQQNNFEGIIRFNKRFMEDKLSVSAFLGGNIAQYSSESFLNSGIGEKTPGVKAITNYLQQHIDIVPYEKEVQSVYGSVNFGYNDYAFLDATLRQDRSSTLPPDNRTYLYPSVSGSFVFSNFFKLEQSTPISFGKIRASWAKVGGDTDPYRLALNYNTLNYSINGKGLGQLATNTMPSKDLKPTSTYSYEFGLDLRLFKSRLNLDLTYYDQSTKDQIMNLPVTKTSGFTYATINAGEITNKGFEIALSGSPVKTKQFEWFSAVNLARNINQVVSLHPDQDYYELAAARWAGAYVYAKAGESYGSIMGYKFKRDSGGNVIFQNGLPTYEEKLSILGNGNYDFTLGFNNNFSFKGFTLGVLLDMKWGADLYSMSAANAHAGGTSKNTLEGRQEWSDSEQARLAANVAQADWTPTGGYIGKGVKNVGTDENPQYVANDVPVNPYDYWNGLLDKTPEPFIYDASYIKLRELTLTYAIPSKYLAKTPFQSVAFTAYGRNLWILQSNIDNIDPESNYNNGNGQGLEYGSLPSRRTYGFGINVKF